MDVVDRALKGHKLTRRDIPALMRALGLESYDRAYMAAVLEGDAAVQGIRVYPAWIHDRTELDKPMRYSYSRGQQQIFKWSTFNLMAQDDVYAIRYPRLPWEQKLQLLRVLLMRAKVSENVSYSLWPTAPCGKHPPPVIDVAFQNEEFSAKPAITTLGDPIMPKPLVAGIETADVLGRDLLSDTDVATLLSISRSKVIGRWAVRKLPPGRQIGSTEVFWVKSVFFNEIPELEGPPEDESSDRLIDLNGISALVGGDSEVFRISRERGGLPIGTEVGDRNYWRESEILQWIGRVRKETPARTYSDDDFWDFDDLARFLNRSRDQIFELIANEQFPAGVHVGDELRWQKADVQRWFADLKLSSLDTPRRSRWAQMGSEFRRFYWKA